MQAVLLGLAATVSHTAIVWLIAFMAMAAADAATRQTLGSLRPEQLIDVAIKDDGDASAMHRFQPINRSTSTQIASYPDRLVIKC